MSFILKLYIELKLLYTLVLMYVCQCVCVSQVQLLSLSTFYDSFFIELMQIDRA